MDRSVLLLPWSFLILIGGYILPCLKNKLLSRTIAWTAACSTTVLAVLLTVDHSPIVRMIIIITLLLLSMKVIVLNETYTGLPRLNFIQWSAFVAWFGMRPVLFEALPSKPLPSGTLFRRGVYALFLGTVILYLSSRIAFDSLSYMPNFLTLFGLSLILHFGILNIVTAGWRMLGVDVRELFPAPYLSKSLTEFWGKRWNTAFSEMTAVVIFRPLREIYSTRAGMVLSFLFSGVLHDIAISVPVNAGYGLPFSYFVIHAGVMLLEESPIVKNIRAHRFTARLWVLFWIVAPLPLLFHASFMKEVLAPVRNAILYILPTA